MSEWLERSLAEVCETIRAGGTPAADNPSFYGGDTPFVTIEDITRAGRTIEHTTRSLTRAGIDASAAWIVPEDHLLYSMYATLGKVTRNVLPMATNQAILAIKPDLRLIETDILFYLLQMSKSSILALASQTTQANLNAEKIRKFKVRFPASLQEQRHIAEILSTLDEAIEQTEALIAKMQQVKAGLMHDLFTRGVTPDGRLRPTREQAPELYKESSLGWIPREWEVKQLGALAEIVSGVTLGSKIVINDGIAVPYLRVANVQDGYLDLTEVKTVHVSQAQFEKLQLRYGDVLMNEGGDFDKLGRGSVWQDEIKPCVHQNHVFRVRSKNDQLRSFYLAFWSQSESGKKYFVLNSKQSTNLASINSTQLNRFPVALPPSDEQGLIEVRLFAINSHSDSLGQELANLRQQKYGLMHDLLTGKTRVL